MKEYEEILNLEKNRFAMVQIAVGYFIAAFVFAYISPFNIRGLVFFGFFSLVLVHLYLAGKFHADLNANPFYRASLWKRRIIYGNISKEPAECWVKGRKRIFLTQDNWVGFQKSAFLLGKDSYGWGKNKLWTYHKRSMALSQVFYLMDTE